MASPSILRARLTKIDEEMDSLESRLRFLTSERQRVINDLNCIVYPVLTLPPEITSEIFFHYVLEPRLGRALKRMVTRDRGPLTLAAVCQSWRDICFSTPCLWASLQIYPNESWDIDDFLRLIKCWLGRAGDHPLDLNIEWSPKLSTKIFSVISHHSARLRTFDFALDAPFSFPNDEIRGYVPLLTKLTVTIKTDCDNPVMITAFRETPCLREVRLYGASLKWISLPWIQLTYLKFWNGSASSCLQILKKTPNLDVLDVCVSDMTTEPLLSSHLPLPFLHTLKVSFDSQGKLFERLFLPALETIHLFHLLGRGISFFIDLAVRSAWPLRSIHLSHMTVDNCIACLQSLPSVTEVEICTYSLNYSDMNKLVTLFHKDRMILPALKTLVFRNCEAEFSSCDLANVLESRSHGHDGEVKLESFRLAFGRLAAAALKEFVGELWVELRPVMDAGLEVSIDFP